MRKYELTVLISPDLTEEKIQSIENEITSLVEESKGSLIGFSKPQKRELGYIIDKKHKEAYIKSIRFSLSPENIKEFIEKIKEKKEILRHILSSKEKKEKQQKEPRRRIKPVDSSPKPAQKKVELGDIDKKINEILSE